MVSAYLLGPVLTKPLDKEEKLLLSRSKCTSREVLVRQRIAGVTFDLVAQGSC